MRANGMLWVKVVKAAEVVRSSENIFATAGGGTDNVIAGAIAREVDVPFDAALAAWHEILPEGAGSHGAIDGEIDPIRVLEDRGIITPHPLHIEIRKLQDLNEEAWETERQEGPIFRPSDVNFPDYIDKVWEDFHAAQISRWAAIRAEAIALLNGHPHAPMIWGMALTSKQGKEWHGHACLSGLPVTV